MPCPGAAQLAAVVRKVEVGHARMHSHGALLPCGCPVGRLDQHSLTRNAAAVAERVFRLLLCQRPCRVDVCGRCSVRLHCSASTTRGAEGDGAAASHGPAAM